MRTSLFLFCLLFALSLSAQPEAVRATMNLEPRPHSGKAFWKSPLYGMPLVHADPFTSFFIVWEGRDDAQLEVRFLSLEGELTDWQPLERDPHNDERRITYPLFIKPGFVLFTVRCKADAVERMTCHFFSPGASPEPADRPREELSRRSDECPPPPVVVRSDWCPTNSCPPAVAPSTTPVSHLIVHHSAGTNEAGDWAAVVRAIWDLHVNGNGWSDIGYNYLIDPDGIVYEGRGNDILGAHFCGANTNTMGVCMLGNFQEREPTEAALAALADLLTWKSADRGLDPLAAARHPASGLTLSHISGHRDGCATACPGDLLYPLLGDLRQRTADQLVACRSSTPLVPLAGAAPLLLRIYPNPVWADELQVHLETSRAEQVSLEIIAADGRRLLHFQREKAAGAVDFTLPLMALPLGYYRLRLRTAQQIHSTAFVRQ